MNNVFREITPLSPHDCFTVFTRDKKDFDFPVHCHEEYELNYILNGKGVRRIVGYHMAEIGDTELVMVGGNIPHAWFTHHFTGDSLHEVTVQFHHNLFDERFLQRNQLSAIRNLLQCSRQGVLFSRETIQKVAPRLEMLSSATGFDSVLELLSILHELATSKNMEILSKATPVEDKPDEKGQSMDKVISFIRQNYHKDITLKEIASLVNMPEVSFSRMIRKHTNRTFIEWLNDIRLSHASRLLINTTYTVAEISYMCGFNNLSYFNRVFRRKNGCTPRELRDNWQGSKVFI
jgi:AraC-like DNA-binding protein